jgi:5'-nucleotidase
VTLVAPVDNRSDSSTSLTVDIFTVTQESANEFTVDGTPATCVGIGIELMNELPDLVVSGMNDSSNLGPITPISGTVGATIYSITRGIPAVAFSTDALVAEEDDPDIFGEHMANGAEFAVRLISELQVLNPHKSLLPEHTALNVNYPPLAPSEIAGVSFNIQGRVGSKIIYLYFAPFDIWCPQIIESDPLENDVQFSDTIKYNKGYLKADNRY